MRHIAIVGALASLAAIGCAAPLHGVSTTREARPIPWPPQSLAENWTVAQDAQGQLTATCNWEYGVVDRRLTIVLDQGSRTPVSGRARYPNGHVRVMNPEEIKLFWDFGGARHAVEQHGAAKP